MKTIITVTGCAISGTICCFGAWKLCESGIGYWPWFLLTGFLILFVSGGFALHKEEESDL
jgi:hypothetical protein